MAVIYPPIRQSSIATSRCLEQNHAQEQAETQKRRTQTPEQEQQSEDSSGTNTFHMLYVGRLATLKCPGLLIRAIGYIAAHQVQYLLTSEQYARPADVYFREQLAVLAHRHFTELPGIDTASHVLMILFALLVRRIILQCDTSVKHGRFC